MQCNCILDLDSATKVSCIEPFRLLLSALGVFSAVFRSATRKTDSLNKVQLVATQRPEFKKLALWVVDFRSTKRAYVVTSSDHL